MAQKPLVRAYINAEVRDQLVSGDVLAAQMWNTTAQQAMDATSELAFAYPSEGYAVYPGCHGDSAREQAPGAGAPVHRLHAAAGHRGGQCAGGADHHHESRRPRRCSRKRFANNATLYPPPDVHARGRVGANACRPRRSGCATGLWTEIKSA